LDNASSLLLNAHKLDVSTGIIRESSFEEDELEEEKLNIR